MAPVSRFATIVADPPWMTRAGRLCGRAGFADSNVGPSKPLPYPTMTEAQIAALPVGAIAADDAHLWMWTINAHLEAALRCVRAWGFRYSTTHVWAKAAIGGGLGGPFGITTEFLIFARRGRLPTRNRIVGTWHTWQRRYVDGAPCHSKKPEGAYAMIDAVSPGPVVELFSREVQPRLGWSYWGNESLGTAELPREASRGV